ncbi:hypothetical protein [Beihai picorna-like virus 104]|uniref:hypothetical protein n=1 Tax=Beihai picorna-like virus 104 TaxID=1922532 RepID=UPI00090CCC8C|nr:hypothetical protein [Beihai picorna-like virus 104]APG78913.1 hypothetical protein [Beihai picorna-like virus 104]
MLRFFEGFDRISSRQQWLEHMVQQLPETIQKLIYTPDIDVEVEINTKIMEITGFIQKHRDNKTSFYNTNEVRLFKTYRSWLDVQSNCLACDANAPRNLLTVLNKLKNELIDIKGKFIDEDFNPHPIEPFCIYMAGEPGVGKSSIAKYIGAAINNQAEKVSQDNLFYVKNPGDPYCTGYTGQFCWIYDDFAQQVSSQDGLDLIKYITPQRAPLNMASMNDPSIGIKGTKQQSLLFICCSNNAYPVFNNLESQEAFLRRRHVVIEMINQTRDPLKGMFRYLDKFQNRIMSPNMNLKELLVDLIHRYNHHIQCQTSLRNQYMGVMEDFGPEKLVLGNNGIEIVAQGSTGRNSQERLSASDMSVLNSLSRADVDDITQGAESARMLALYRRVARASNMDRGIEEFLDAREEDNQVVTTTDVIAATTENVRYWTRLKNRLKYRLKVLLYAFRQYLCSDVKSLLSIFTIATCTAGYLMYKNGKESSQEQITTEGSSSHKNKVQKHKEWLEQQKLAEWNAKCYNQYMDYYDMEYEAEGVITMEKLTQIINKDSDNVTLSIHTNSDRNKFERILTQVSNKENIIKRTGNKVVLKTDFGKLIVDNNHKQEIKNEKPEFKQVESEGCEDIEALNISKVVSNQLMTITTVCYSGEDVSRTMTMSALPVKGQLILAPRHLFMYQGKYMTGTIKLYSRGCPLPILEFDKNNVIEFPGEYGPADIVLYYLGARSRSFRDITNLFCTKRTLSNLTEKFDISLIKQVNGDIIHYFTKNTEMTVSQKSYDASGCMTVLGKILQYDLSTEKGDCGSVAILFHPSAEGKIIGMHIAGALSISKGFAKPISRELLLDRIAEAEKKFGKQLNGVGIERIKNSIISAEGKEIDIDLPVIGLLERSNFMPTKTKYIESEVFESCGRHRCEPAILSPNDARNPAHVSPLYLAVNKYAEQNYFIPKDIMVKIKTALPVLFKREIMTPLREFDMETLINGNNEEYIDPLNMKSSPGWPYDKSKDGKRHLFDINENGKYVPKGLLEERLMERRQLGEKGERIASIWTDCLKDETRPMEKIRELKTRSFSVAPVDFNIWLRYFTMDFKKRICDNRIKNGIAIGINPYSLEWTMLAHHMTEYSSTGYAGDYAGYDRMLHSELMELCLNFVFEHFSNKSVENELFFKTLIQELKFATCSANQYVYLRTQGLPSGADFTASLNSMVGICYLLYAWLITAPCKMQNVASFIANVRYQVFGDDNMFFPRDSVKKFYNFESVRDALKLIGITYTPETKDDLTNVAARPIHDMQFLSNGFRPEGGFYKATLKMISIIEMTNWITNKIPSHQATKDNINTALRFLYFYGPNVYHKFYKLWVEWADFTYDVLDNIYITNGGFDDILDFENNLNIWKVEPQGNTINHIQNMQGWSHISRATLPSEITGDKLDNKFKFSAMDKPAVTLTCPPTAIKDFQGLSNASNIEYINKLALNPSTLQETTSANTAEEEDEMSVLYIARKWGFIRGAVEGTPASWTVNYNIMSDYAIDPCYALCFASVNPFHISPLTLSAMYANFWRGSLEYKFIFFTDGFTTGKVCVDFRYGVYDKYVDPAKTSEKNSQYSVIMDINPHKYIFHVRVPYMHAAPWLNCRNANYTASLSAKNYEHCVSLGFMNISVINPFTGSSGERCKVRMNILERAGEDFEVAGSFSNNLTVVCEGAETEIIGNNSSMHVPMGEVAKSNGTTIDTIGSSKVESVNGYGSTQVSMNVRNISFEYFFDRWQQIGTSTLITSSSPALYIDLYSKMRSVVQWDIILKQYVYFKCAKAQVRIEVNGNPFCSGGLVAAHLPVVANYARKTEITEFNIVNLQHGILNYNTTSSITLNAPFIIDSDFVSLPYHLAYDTDTQPGIIDNVCPLGSLLLNFSFAPLQRVGTTPQSPSYAIFMKVEDPVLKIPITIRNVTTRVEDDGIVAKDINVVPEGSESYMQNMDSEMITVGEYITLPKDVTISDPIDSFRSLIRKYSTFDLLLRRDADLDLYMKPLEVRQTNIMPFSKDYTTGFLRLMPRIFALYRGGLRFKIRAVTVNSETDDSTVVSNTTLKLFNASMKAKHPVRIAVAYTPRSYATDSTDSSVFQDYFVNDPLFPMNSTPTYDMTVEAGFLEFEVPFGCNTNWKSFNDTDNPSFASDPILRAIIYNQNYSDVNVNLTALAAAADDLRFKSFIGVTPARLYKTKLVPDAYA